MKILVFSLAFFTGLSIPAQRPLSAAEVKKHNIKSYSEKQNIDGRIYVSLKEYYDKEGRRVACIYRNWLKNELQTDSSLTRYNDSKGSAIYHFKNGIMLDSSRSLVENHDSSFSYVFFRYDLKSRKTIREESLKSLSDSDYRKYVMKQWINDTLRMSTTTTVHRLNDSLIYYLENFAHYWKEKVRTIRDCTVILKKTGRTKREQWSDGRLSEVFEEDSAKGNDRHIRYDEKGREELYVENTRISKTQSTSCIKRKKGKSKFYIEETRRFPLKDLEGTEFTRKTKSGKLIYRHESYKNYQGWEVRRVDYEGNNKTRTLTFCQFEYW